MAGNSREPGRSVTARALSVMSVFDQEHAELSLTGIARRADIPLATAHRLVGELEAWGALQRDANGKYVIGLRLWELGSLTPVNRGLRQLAMPLMQELSAGTQLDVHLAVRDGMDAVAVERLKAPRSVLIISQANGRLPLHATSVGKVLLAEETESFLHSYCERGLTPYTAQTITAQVRLAQELHDVRSRGHAENLGEFTPGNSAVAVPVHDPQGSVIAALGLVTQSASAEPAKLARALLPTAEHIRKSLAEQQRTAGVPVDRRTHIT